MKSNILLKFKEKKNENYNIFNETHTHTYIGRQRDSETK